MWRRSKEICAGHRRMNASRRKLIIINDDDSLFSIRLSFLPAPFVRPMKSACSVPAESPATIGERRRLIHEHVIKLLKCFLTEKDFLINCGAAGGSASCSFAVFLRFQLQRWLWRCYGLYHTVQSRHFNNANISGCRRRTGRHRFDRCNNLWHKLSGRIHELDPSLDQSLHHAENRRMRICLAITSQRSDMKTPLWDNKGMLDAKFCFAVSIFCCLPCTTMEMLLSDTFLDTV